MINSPPTTIGFSRYLRILGADCTPPSLVALSQLVRAHLVVCPFENISKLYRGYYLGIREFPTLDDFLDGIEHHNFGGTCYVNNYYLYLLLCHLKYDAIFCGADMSEPDVHTAILVKLNGSEYLIDVGYAAPFFAPLPRNLTEDYRIRWGRDEYVLRPRDVLGRSRLDHFRDGKAIHGYLAKPKPRDLNHFTRVIRESLEDNATFMNAVRLERFSFAGSVSLYNNSLWFLDSRNCSTKRLNSKSEIIAAIVEFFDMPIDIVKLAIDPLSELRDIHGFCEPL